MSYFQAKSDLEFMQEFLPNVMKLWEMEEEATQRLMGRATGLVPRAPTEAAVQQEADKSEDYRRVRAQVAQGVPHAKRIASRLGLLGVYESYPMPAVGGAVIPVTLFDAILYDPSYNGVPQQLIVDALNQTLGACDERVDVELRHLKNPIYWVKEVLAFVIRIPFILIEASGFDVSKVEDHFLGRLFKLIEIAVLLGFLVWLGLSREEIRQAMVTIFSP